MVGFAWLSWFWCLLFAVLFWTVFELPVATCLCLTGAVVLAALPHLLRVTSSRVAGNILVLVLFCLLGALNWYLGGFSVPLLIWYAFLPALAGVVGQSGLVWVLIVIAQLLGLYFLQVVGWGQPERLDSAHLQVLKVVTLLGFVGLMVTLTTLYQSFEHQMLRKLRRSNRELAKARDQALAASLAKTSFLTNMSHEFRTPLNAIIGYSDMLLDEGEPPERLVSDLQRIRAAGSHLLRMVNDLLDLSKIESGKLELEIETFSVKTLMEDLEGIIRPDLARNRNQLVLERAPQVGQLSSDATKLRQCLLNLLSNACKFTQAGTITLSVAQDEERVRFAVRDTGIGMTAEELERVFAPFAQADASTARRFGGTGLGLTICDKLAALLGGELKADSVPGQGSCFVVSVPGAISASPPPPPG